MSYPFALGDRFGYGRPAVQPLHSDKAVLSDFRPCLIVGRMHIEAELQYFYLLKDGGVQAKYRVERWSEGQHVVDTAVYGVKDGTPFLVRSSRDDEVAA